MAGTYERRATGALNAKTCSLCKIEKPIDAFPWYPNERRYCSWCKVCKRVRDSERRETDKYKEWLAAYNAKEEVKARKRAINERLAGTPKRQEQLKRYRATLRARLVIARNKAVNRLKGFTDPAKIAKTQALIDAQTREIDRLAEQ